MPEIRRTLALLAALLLPPAAAHAGGDVAAGKALFDSTCAACHTVGGGVKVGPDLQGVTERRAADWLVRQIADPQSLKDAGDPTALANAQQFPLKMPALGLTSEQVDSVVAWLASTAASTTPPPPPGRPAPYLPTLGIAVAAAALLTWIGLAAGSKKVEVRP